MAGVIQYSGAVIRRMLVIVVLVVTPTAAQAPQFEVVSIRPADRKQFPLRLQPGRAPIDALVVERAIQPSEN